MLNTLFNKKELVIGFVVTMIIVAVLIISASIYDYYRVRASMEHAVIREGLTAIATFQAFARIGMQGPSSLTRERLYDAVRETCFLTPVEYFAFIDPSNRVFKVTRDSEVQYVDPSLGARYRYLAPGEYKAEYCCPDCRELTIVTPLNLDSHGSMGIKTVRFYKTLLNRRRQGNILQQLRPARNNLHLLPLVMVGLPTDAIIDYRNRTIFVSTVTGLVFFLFITALIYLAIVRQQQRVITHALNDVRADNERLLRNLRFSDRLAVLGRMAAAMAHELRNPLGSVRGFIQLFRKKSLKEHDDSMCSYADTVIAELDRLNAVITSMLDFSRPVEPSFELTELQPFFRNVIDLFKQDAASKNVSIISHVPDNLPPVALDRNLFTQALLNLFINALESMPDGGELTVEISVKDPGLVCIQIVDTGKGIPKELQKQIFEPFFTTKASGTGLGLATVEKIVEEHGGSIKVESVVNEGSIFHIELPIHRT